MLLGPVAADSARLHVHFSRAATQGPLATAPPCVFTCFLPSVPLGRCVLSWIVSNLLVADKRRVVAPSTVL